MKNSNRLVSIIIRTKNEAKWINSCLKAIKKQDFDQKKIQIIVLDNNSIDGTIDIVKKFNVKLVKYNPPIYLPGHSLNQAVKKAKNEKDLLNWWPKFSSLSESLNAAIPEFLLATTKPTLAHITLYNFYHCFFDDIENAQKAVGNCGKIVSMCLLVKHNPQVIEWEKTRPETPF